VGLERGPLCLLSTTEELLERKCSGSGLEIREYVRRDPSCSPSGILYPHKLALTSPKSVSRSFGIVRSRTQATEFLHREIGCEDDRWMEQAQDHVRWWASESVTSHLTQWPLSHSGPEIDL
jgi:hypothetical protein